MIRSSPKYLTTLAGSTYSPSDNIAGISSATSSGLARGGGSLEDLWCFNNEKLAYEIYKSSIPIVSAIGHETDTTISDLVADKRAGTPSIAAEIIAPSVEQCLQNIDFFSDKIFRRKCLQTILFQHRKMKCRGSSETRFPKV